MKYRGLVLHLSGREPVICTVSGLRPGTRSMTQMTHDLDKHLTTGWHERERRQAEQRRQTGQRCPASQRRTAEGRRKEAEGKRHQAVQRGALDQAACRV